MDSLPLQVRKCMTQTLLPCRGMSALLRLPSALAT